MELIDEPNPALCQVRPGLIEQRQRVSEVFGLEGTAVSLQRGRAGRSRCVDLIVLAATAARQLAHPCRRGRRNGDHVLTASQQPRQMPSQAFGVLDRPPRRSNGPPTSAAGASQRGGFDAAARPVRLRVYCCRRACSWVGRHR